jgi:hypothetical protein
MGCDESQVLIDDVDVVRGSSIHGFGCDDALSRPNRKGWFAGSEDPAARHLGKHTWQISPTEVKSPHS